MIFRRSQRELAHIRAASRIVAQVHDLMAELVQPGVTTQKLDQAAEALIREHGAEPAFKGYHGYPATICASVNEEVVHGIPDGRRLKRGDIISLDVGVRVNGYHGDSANTLPVGEIDESIQRLLQVTEESLYKGIAQARVGHRLSDISYAIQSWVESQGFSVVRDFVGHGIGRNLHEEPSIPNFGAPHLGPRLQPGMVLAIEPMVNMGKFAVKLLSNGWTAVAVDGHPSAHFEHTVAITDGDPEILTLRHAVLSRSYSSLEKE